MMSRFIFVPMGRRNKNTNQAHNKIWLMCFLHKKELANGLNDSLMRMTREYNEFALRNPYSGGGGI